MCNSDVKAGLALPPFVTAESVGELLNWANSIKRAIREAAQKHPLRGWAPAADCDDIYRDIVRLLSRPAGGKELERLIAAADCQKRRGLRRAIQKKARGVLGSDLAKEDGPAALVCKLRGAGDDELAAWLAFVCLAWSNGPGNALDPELVELLEHDEDLRTALGDYFNQWLSLPDVGNVQASSSSPDRDAYLDQASSSESFGVPGPSAVAPAPTVAQNDADADRAAWSGELEALRRDLQKVHEIDSAVTERLEAALRRLAPIVARTEERSAAQARRLAERAQEHVNVLRAELDAIEGEVVWREALLAAAARAPLDAVAVDQLEDAAVWAASARRENDAAVARRKAALQRAWTDESQEAAEDLVGATAKRQRVRQDIDRSAARWIEALSGNLTGVETPAEPKAVPSGGDAAGESFDDGRGAEESPDVDIPTVADTPAATTRSAESSEAVEFETEPESRDWPPPTVAVPEPAGHDVPAVGEVDVERAASRDGSAAPPPAVASMAAHDMRGYDGLVGRALYEGRYGLAAHLQRAIETLGCTDPAPAPSWVLEALCIGSAVTAGRLSTAEHRYTAVLPRVLADLGRVSAHAESTRLLVFAGAIKPALFSMQTAAAEAIRVAAVGGLGAHLHELAEFVVEQLPKRGGALDLTALKPAADERQLRDEIEGLRRRILEMAEGAPAKRALFARATIIWRDLFQKDGSVSRAVAAIRRQAANTPALAEEAGEELERHLKERARELDRAAKRNHDAWLEGKALEWLLTSLRDLSELLHAYVAAARRAAAHKSKHGEETRKILGSLVTAARKDIGAPSVQTGLRLASHVAGRVLDDVAAMLEGRSEQDDAALTVDMLLDGDLLLVRPYPAKARTRELDREAATSLLEGTAAVLEQTPDFRSAFGFLVASGRFDEAGEALEWLPTTGDALGQELADARRNRLGEIEARATALRVRLDDLLGADTEGKIDPGYSVQLENLIGSLTGPDLAPEEIAQRLDFPTTEGELARLETAVRDGADLLLAPLRREIEALGDVGPTGGILRDLADRRELTALRELVNGLKAGADLDLSGHQEKLLRAFAERFLSPAFAGEPQQRNIAELVQAATERRKGPLVDFSLLAEDDLPAAKELLSAWLRLKRAGDNTRAAALCDVLTELRFTNVRVNSERKLQRGRRYTLHCQPTSDRRDCPAPDFGSAANGRLEVLLLDAVHVTDGVELHGLVKALEHNSTVPTLIIVTGVLPADRRVNFMREARRFAAQMPCALLDEAGVLFLATLPRRRRADVFTVALPGGGVQPYSDASGKTSPEMFFGRSVELGELWRADGSCLVFGGRQLGKTALLEQVRLRNHKSPGQIVVYGSLQGETDLWRKVTQWLGEGGLLVKGHSAGAVEGAVREWLRADEARRLLILVDEADTYLEVEMQNGYRSLARVRDLMQATKRRCKFVFAGLHNVQRLARSPNSPLLHFGVPLRIGPLFGQDLGEAREMVVGPMAAAGIVFKDPTLPNRILSAVGFYPSLLQTFGATLIERVNRSANARLKAASPLPIVVQEHDIQSALEDNDFKENIREKFRKTLSLDERYRLITLAMLARSLDRREQTGIAPSLSDVEVQALAREWWPQGFEDDSSLDAFQGLLQEMVGLGVLVVSGDRYAIRSSRIAAMLGGKEQIEQELVELSGSPGPQKLDTGNLRRLDRATRSPSPLTSRQEGHLLDGSATAAVHLALGSKALGLEKVATSLLQLRDEDLAIHRATYRTAREFAAELANTGETVRRGRTSLLILSGPWLGREMVDFALEAGSRRSTRGAAARVLIVPTWIDWEAADEIDEDGRLWGAQLLALTTLGRSGLGQWLRARGTQEAPAIIEELRRLTGGYPLHLSGFGKTTDAEELMRLARQAYEQRLADPGTLADLGLQDERLLGAARIVGQFDPADLAADLDSMGFTPGDRVAGHLERLGVVETVQDGGGARRRLNPLVAAVLSHQS